jgi:adenine phosphoribosyltransferase
MSDGIERVAALLRPVPNFPKEGILFWDIEPVLRDTKAMDAITEAFDHYWIEHDIDVIAGFDARGFIFGSVLAHQIDLPFVQIRKKGKLPGKVVSQAYALEYGEAEVEMIDDGFIAGKRVLLVDDLLATGGTALAGAQLVERLGGVVAGFACVTEIPILGGRGKLMHYPVQSLISIIGDQPEWEVEYCADLYIEIDEKWLVYINRLSEPFGHAMPGGRIEAGESALTAAAREAGEEIGCPVTNLSYVTTLAQRGRDPRGHKVSIVFQADTTESAFKGENGKTEVVYSPLSQLPPPELFAFDHGPFVHTQIAK